MLCLGISGRCSSLAGVLLPALSPERGLTAAVLHWARFSVSWKAWGSPSVHKSGESIDCLWEVQSRLVGGLTPAVWSAWWASVSQCKMLD